MAYAIWDLKEALSQTKTHMFGNQDRCAKKAGARLLDPEKQQLCHSDSDATTEAASAG